MDFNKITQTIHDKNFSIAYFIPEVIGMTPKGFKIACERKTLKVVDLEKISKALNVPITYWWDENAKLICQEPSEPYSIIIEENRRLKRQVDANLDLIEKLKIQLKEKK